jgi:hypothetical protein
LARAGAKWWVTASRTAWRCAREVVGSELREHRAHGVLPEPLGCEHLMAPSGPVPSRGRLRGTAAASPRRGHSFGRRQHRFEKSAAGLGQRAIVVVRSEPAICDQDLVGMHVAASALARASVAVSI